MQARNVQRATPVWLGLGISHQGFGGLPGVGSANDFDRGHALVPAYQHVLLSADRRDEIAKLVDERRVQRRPPGHCGIQAIKIPKRFAFRGAYAHCRIP